MLDGAQRSTALQRQCTKNLKQIFQEMKLRGLSPNSYIHVSVSDLFIPTIGLPIVLQENRRPLVGIIKSLTRMHECGNWN
jgi:hypothetical protein